VAGDEGRGGLDGPVAFGGVQVGVTDATGFHFDLDLFGTGLGDGHFLDDEGLSEFAYDCGFHSFCHGGIPLGVAGGGSVGWWVAPTALIWVDDGSVGLRPTLV